MVSSCVIVMEPLFVLAAVALDVKVDAQMKEQLLSPYWAAGSSDSGGAVSAACTCSRCSSRLSPRMASRCRRLTRALQCICQASNLVSWGTAV